MALTSVVVGHRRVMGDLYVVTGTFVNADSSEGGTIETGLSEVVFAIAQHTGAAAVASAPSFNETFPTTDGDLTIVTTADADGIWIAFGLA